MTKSESGYQGGLFQFLVTSDIVLDLWCMWSRLPQTVPYILLKSVPFFACLFSDISGNCQPILIITFCLDEYFPGLDPMSVPNTCDVKSHVKIVQSQRRHACFQRSVSSFFHIYVQKEKITCLKTFFGIQSDGLNRCFH